jgi:HSP20 family protein
MCCWSKLPSESAEDDEVRRRATSKRRNIMGLLEKWRPSRELDRYRSEFDDAGDRFASDREWFDRWPVDRPFFAAREPIASRPAIDCYVEDGKLIVRTELPGIDAKDVDIRIVGDVLTIKGSREEKRETKKTDYLTREIRYRSFERSMSLPEGIKPEDLKAAYRDGILQLSAPLPKEAAPREVTIQVERPPVLAEKKAEAA